PASAPSRGSRSTSAEWRRPGQGENELPTVEGLRVVVGCVRFHAAQPQHGSEEVFGEPALSALALELVEKVAYLPPADLVVQVDEQVRRAEVSVELRDLVLQNHVVPERVPGELRDQPVILVPIFAVMGEDEVRRHPPLDLLEEALHRLPLVRQEAVPEILDHD